MLLSIVVLSYNRPEQIKRICEKLSIANNPRFNLIIKDDCSPRQSEIEELIQDYAKGVRFNVIFHKNKKNLGYDGNLIDSFYITDAEYVFLLSDDDYIDGANIDELVRILEAREFKLYFTPYIHSGGTSRTKISSFSLKRFHHIIYNSILFSGLVFHRSTILKLPKDMTFLLNCIYSQVYFSAKVAFEERGFGSGPVNLLYLGGDGENFFGRNEAAVNRKLLSDRESITANLKYQGLLLKVVERAASETDIRILELFNRERSRRILSYLLRARGDTVENFMCLKVYINDPKNEFSLIVRLFSHAVLICPPFLARCLNKTLVRLMKRSG